MAEFLDKTGLAYFWSKIKEKLDANKTKADNLQNQIIDSSLILADDTAPVPFSAGTCVVINGKLREITSPLTKGTKIDDTNSVSMEVIGLIKNVQFEFESLMPQMIEVESTGNQGIPISPKLSGRQRFVCWIGVSSVGFESSPYIDQMHVASATIYDKNTEAGHSYKAYYLAYNDSTEIPDTPSAGTTEEENQ